MLIAQVSDIHASPDNDHLSRFDQVLAWLVQLQPDVLVLSGDLTDEGWSEGYQQIAERLSHQRYPSLILPGNADDRHLMRSVWGADFWAKDTSEGLLHTTFDAEGIQLIGLDSTVDGKEHGTVIDRLGWLEAQLSRADAAPSMLFMHHHVFDSGIPTLDETRCQGLDRLEACIRSTPGPVLAISSGHVHRPVAGLFAGVPAFICGSVCPANPVWFGTDNVPPAEIRPGLMLHRYVGGTLTHHHVSV